MDKDKWQHVCLHCGHDWTTPGSSPPACPKCGNPWPRYFTINLPRDESEPEPGYGPGV